MPLKTAIITEKLGGPDATDSTIIADGALERGHIVYETYPAAISHIEDDLIANARIYTGAALETKQENIRINLARDVDVIHFRPNPPVDMGYLTTLYLLNEIKDKVLIINNPEAIIKFPEKILPLRFPGFIPPTIVTEDFKEISAFAKKYAEIVIKPIYDYSGHGVRKYKYTELGPSKEDIELFITQLKTPVIVQKFLPNVTKGDKRVFFIDGEIVGGDLRVPKTGSFLANTLWGSTIQKTVITDREREFGKLLKPLLQENGIYLCGIDVIDGYVTEINITSPAGFGPIKTLYGQNLEPKLWEIIEQKLQ